jgi:hypothetical protein
MPEEKRNEKIDMLKKSGELSFRPYDYSGSLCRLPVVRNNLVISGFRLNFGPELEVEICP